MSDKKLKTAVLGLDEKGQQLLKAACQTGHFEIQAVADKNGEHAKELAARYDCASYDDWRQLIIQNQLDCLLVAEGMHSCDEYIRAAMKKKFNVLKLAPLARNVAEATEFVRLAEHENIKFAVANVGRYAEGFLALRGLLQEGLLKQVFLITIHCNVDSAEYSAWKTDPKLSGGGVLLWDCYEMIDQLIWNFGVPQEVYSLNTSTASDRQQRQYLTEDIAVVTMKFTDTCFGSINACRCPGMEANQKFLKVYAPDKIVTVNDSGLIISNNCDQISENCKYDNAQAAQMTELLDNFALSILVPGEYKLASTAAENLKNMAVIESAYLSARTAMPEQPARVLKMQSVEQVNI